MSGSTPAQIAQSPDKPGVPFRSTSYNYTSAQESASDPAPPIVKIPDGRRNSQGEKLPSPVESWKPNLARRQSWNREDLKREHVVTQLVGKVDEVGEEAKEGWGTGFTEERREGK